MKKSEKQLRSVIKKINDEAKLGWVSPKKERRTKKELLLEIKKLQKNLGESQDLIDFLEYEKGSSIIKMAGHFKVSETIRNLFPTRDNEDCCSIVRSLVMENVLLKKEAGRASQHHSYEG